MGEKKTKVLFVCVENSVRSQMAEGLLRSLAGDNADVYSAGSRPGAAVNPMAVAVMAEIGLDISGQRPKGYLDLTEKNFDHVISMGCGDVCPFFPAKDTREWRIEPPKVQDIKVFRRVRDRIKQNVEALFEEMIGG